MEDIECNLNRDPNSISDQLLKLKREVSMIYRSNDMLVSFVNKIDDCLTLVDLDRSRKNGTTSSASADEPTISPTSG
jgi:hypothetical protein